MFSSYNQVSKYVEGNFVYNNTEGYIQDNWKVNSRLTLDYGMRFVHQQPQYDELGQAANFLPEKWARVGRAGALLAPAARRTPVHRRATGRRWIRAPGHCSGPNTTVAIGTLVPNSGNPTNGLFLSGQGIAKTTYTWPALELAPRFGMAYDLTGHQKIVLRGGAGLFFDRPAGNSVYSAGAESADHPRTSRVRYGNLQALEQRPDDRGARRRSTVYQYESDLPSTWQWNGGVQMALPWAIDARRRVRRAAQLQPGRERQHQRRRLRLGASCRRTRIRRCSSALPGGAAVVSDQMRAFRGYSSITQAQPRGWRTFHSLQLSFNRRFRNGVSFGFNDTWLLSQTAAPAARLQHNADGTFSDRADQAQADELLGNFIPVKHNIKGNFVWDLPDLHGTSERAEGRSASSSTTGSCPGVWTGRDGQPPTPSARRIRTARQR